MPSDEFAKGLRALIPAALLGFALFVGSLAAIVEAIRFLVHGTLP
jgi:hypothetical protein